MSAQIISNSLSSLGIDEYTKRKLKVLVKGFFYIALCCFLNSLITYFTFAFLFKTKFAKFFDFELKFHFLETEITFPFLKKNIILLIIILAIQTAITKTATDYFEYHKLKYKNILADQNLIERPKAKTADKARKDYWIAMIIVCATVSLRNLLREPREILQYIFNNSAKYAIFSIPIIIFIDFAGKLTKKVENSKCNDLLTKEITSNKKKTTVIPYIPIIKEFFYSRFKSWKKFDSFINDIISLSVGVFFGLIFAKLFVHFNILKNFQITFELGNNLIIFIDNAKFLTTNIFFDFFFSSLAVAFLASKNFEKNKTPNDEELLNSLETPNDEELLNSLETLNDKKIRKIFICAINAALFSIGLSATILIPNTLDFSQIQTIGDFIKLNLVLSIAYLFISAAYTIPSSICEIQDAKEHFKSDKTNSKTT